jgi:hypothetical protein
MNKLRNISAHYGRLCSKEYGIRLKIDDKTFCDKFQKKIYK